METIQSVSICYSPFISQMNPQIVVNISHFCGEISAFYFQFSMNNNEFLQFRSMDAAATAAVTAAAAADLHISKIAIARAHTMYYS